MVLAEKKGEIGLLYVFCAIMGLVLVVARTETIMTVAGAIVMLFGLGVAVDYFMMPHDLIKMNGHDNFEIKNSDVVPIGYITEVSYQRARGRGIYYKWGTIHIKTQYKNFAVRYVRDCEQATADIDRVIREHNARVASFGNNTF